MNQTMVKCEVLSWGIAPAPRCSHGIFTCSRMEKTTHPGLPKGADLSWIGFNDPTPPFFGTNGNRRSVNGVLSNTYVEIVIYWAGSFHRFESLRNDCSISMLSGMIILSNSWTSQTSPSSSSVTSSAHIFWEHSSEPD